MRQRIVLVFVFAIAGVMMASLPVHAQVPTQGISLQISPLPIELSTKPGTAVTTDLRVRNAGEQPERLQLHILKVSEDDNGVVHLAEPGRTDDWASWISFSQKVFDAPPGEWQTIRMTINVPKTAAFGYYFAVEYMRASDVQPQPGQAVAHGAVATFVLLNADAPGAIREANVVSFKVDHSWFEFLPVTFTVKVRDGGNVHVAPHGNIFITKDGAQIGNVAVNTAGGNILPHGSRFFSASWSDGFPHGETKISSDGQPVLDKHGTEQQQLKWDFSRVNHLRFGHYTARLVLVYDNGQRDVPLQASVSFWVVPWRILAGLSVVVIFMGVGLWSSSRKLGKFVGRQTARMRNG